MEYRDIDYRVERAAAIITIAREDRLNAFRGRTIEELIHAFKRASSDRSEACVDQFAHSLTRAECWGR